jgi:site-specific recombinase XerD
MNTAVSSNSFVVDGKRRNFLTESEVARMLKAARQGRHGERDRLLVLLSYRHGYRVSELIDVRMSEIDLDVGHIYVRRRKGSLSTTQPLGGDEIRAIRASLRAHGEMRSPYLFLGERGPLTRQAVNYLFKVIGKRASLELEVHPHMLRHSTGFYLANKGYDARLIQDYLGHRDIRHTEIYTRTATARFQGLWY